MNKRDFVLAAAGSVLAGCAGSALAAGSAAPLAQPTRAGWQGRVGQRFAVFGGAAGSALVLHRVQAHPSGAGTEQFTLVFAADGAAPAAGTHTLHSVGQRHSSARTPAAHSAAGASKIGAWANASPSPASRSQAPVSWWLPGINSAPRSASSQACRAA